MECEEWDRIEALARSSVAKWKSHPLYPDLLQELRLFVWQNREKPNGVIVWLGKHKTIDILRLTDGRKGKPDYLRRTPLNVTDEYLLDVIGCREDDYDTIMELGFTGRHELLARMIEVGYTKQEVAEVLGTHPTRVSQLIGEMRKVTERTARAS